MHLAKSFLLIMGLFSGANALAGDDPFTGFRAGLGLTAGASRHQINTTPIYRSVAAGAGAHTIWTANGSREGFVTPTADLSYGFPLGERWIGTVGLRADLRNLDAGDTELASARGEKDTASFKLKRHASVYLQPGYRLSDNWQLYGSLSYHQANAEYGTTSVEKRSGTLKGIGLGFGAERAFNKQLSLRMEIESVAFNSYSLSAPAGKVYDAKYNQARANVLMNYRF